MVFDYLKSFKEGIEARHRDTMCLACFSFFYRITGIAI